MRAALPGSPALVVELLAVGSAGACCRQRPARRAEIRTKPRNIDTAACAARGIKVLTIRRRANIACAELVLTLMLTLAKKLHRLAGRISVEQLAEIGYPYKPFDRRHTANSNWPRISGLRTLNEETLGIIGLGEIGREVAIRAAAFGMRIRYFQRTPAARGGRAGTQGDLCAARDAARRERLGGTAIAERQRDARLHRPRRASRR